MKVIFLDIDGVLNGHGFDRSAQSCTIRPDCVVRFNRLLRETGAKVVLSSAWRYMVTGGAMTVRGFEYMLRTHGVAGCHIIGHTCTDEECAGRGKQIRRWVEESPYGPIDAYVVLDDEEYDIREPSPTFNHAGTNAHPFVRTDGKVGLTDADVEAAVRLLLSPTERGCPRAD